MKTHCASCLPPRLDHRVHVVYVDGQPGVKQVEMKKDLEYFLPGTKPRMYEIRIEGCQQVISESPAHLLLRDKVN